MIYTIENAVLTALTYYKNNNLPIPINVVSYIKSYPKGLSRQVLDVKYGIKCSEFVKLLNPEYVKPLDAYSRAQTESKRLNYTLLTTKEYITNNRDTVSLLCNLCGRVLTTVTSLSGSKLGCLKCFSGNLPWYKRAEELEKLLNTQFNACIVSEIPRNQSGYITVKHLLCGTEYSSQLLGFVSPNSRLRGTCPNCRDTDRRVTEGGHTFGSQFELECFQLLKHLNPEMHVKYSDYFNTDRRWVCDFKFGDIWVEVSNFKVDYKGYFSNIEEKELLVSSNGAHFFFLQSLKEVREFVEIFNTKI
jgi:hypothetical protein